MRPIVSEQEEHPETCKDVLLVIRGTLTLTISVKKSIIEELDESYIEKLIVSGAPAGPETGVLILSHANVVHDTGAVPFYPDAVIKN